MKYITETETRKLESLETVLSWEDLLRDPTYVSFELRRHSAYTSSGDLAKHSRGFLSADVGKVDPQTLKRDIESLGGVHLVQGTAEKLIAHFPEGAEVSLMTSTSYMPARPRGEYIRDDMGKVISSGILDVRTLSDEQLDQLREKLSDDWKNLDREELAAKMPLNPDQVSSWLQPQRAIFSGREYARELYRRGLIKEEPKNQITRDGQLELVGAETGAEILRKEPRLGDLLEKGTPEGVPAFYKVLAASKYGRPTPEFWRDYENGTLDPEVHKALKDAGGWDHLDEARNYTNVLIERTVDLANKPTKQIQVAIGHGDGIPVWLHQIEEYLKTRIGVNDQAAVAVEALSQATSIGGYNEGFGVHVNPRNGSFYITLDAHPEKGIQVIKVPTSLRTLQTYFAQREQERAA